MEVLTSATLVIPYHNCNELTIVQKNLLSRNLETSVDLSSISVHPTQDIRRYHLVLTMPLNPCFSPPSRLVWSLHHKYKIRAPTWMTINGNRFYSKEVPTNLKISRTFEIYVEYHLRRPDQFESHKLKLLKFLCCFIRMQFELERLLSPIKGLWIGIMY